MNETEDYLSLSAHTKATYLEVSFTLIRRCYIKRSSALKRYISISSKKIDEKLISGMKSLFRIVIGFKHHHDDQEMKLKGNIYDKWR